MGIISPIKTTTPLVAILLTTSILVTSELTQTFYDDKCPQVFSIVRHQVLDSLLIDTRMPASLLRLHFHDCFVHGCDASILLDNSISILSEKSAIPNADSLRGFDIVDNIKTRVEETCPGIVSCADILSIAAEASVSLAGGPSWKVYVGRRDSKEAYMDIANTALPAPNDTLQQIKAKFSNVGLKTSVDVVALSGGHTFGRAHCRNVEDRLYNFKGRKKADPTMESSYLKKVRRECPKSRRGTQIANLDIETPDVFDNLYFPNLMAGSGLLPSDQELFSTPGADTVGIVESFASDQEAFFEKFAESMVKMGNISPLTGRMGDIRKKCRFVNQGITSVAKEEHFDDEL